MHPKDNLGYLLHHLAATLDRQSDTLLQKELGIGFSQFKILMALKMHSGVQQKQIADRLGQTEASISRQIRLLQQDGLLQSKQSTSNRRQHITTLTSKGDTVVSRAMELLNAHYTPLFARLTPKQQEDLRSSLQSMHDHICDTH